MEDETIKGEWSKELTFLAYPSPSKVSEQIRYYVYSTSNPERHRVHREIDPEFDIVESEGWKKEFDFWAFSIEKSNTVGYTVLYMSNPYQSQIVEGIRDTLPGWKVHSLFWAYPKEGQYRKIKTNGYFTSRFLLLQKI